MTVSPTVLSECARAPLVPVTVRFQEPVLVLPLVEIVSVEVVPGFEIVLGLNEAVGATPPPGKPLSESLTAPVKPFRRVIVTV